jgi:hypothetical protein
MTSCGMLCRVDFARTDVSQEHVASIFRVERIRELGATSAVTIRIADIFHPKDVSNTFLRNVDANKTHTAPHPRVLHASEVHL